MAKTSLHLASITGDVEVIRALLSAGADVNTTNESGATPLHYAATFGKLDAIRELLAEGADVTLVANDGQTALDVLTAEHPTLAWPAP